MSALKPVSAFQGFRFSRRNPEPTCFSSITADNAAEKISKIIIPFILKEKETSAKNCFIPEKELQIINEKLKRHQVDYVINLLKTQHLQKYDVESIQYTVHGKNALTSLMLVLN